MKTRQCPLCLQTKEIVDSHLIPKAMYALCRAKDSEPVSFTSKFVMQTSRQFHHPLLCLECEGLLNSAGEDWLLPLLATLEGNFPFYDILSATAPALEEADRKMYATAQNDQVDAHKLAHFAMGVFWKTSIHSWSGTERTPVIELGKYREDARAFLRGEASFPQNMVLTIGVLPPPVKVIVFNVPYRGSKTNCHNYLFYVPGVAFALSVGKGLSQEERATCFVSNPAHPVLVTDFSDDIRARIRETTAKAKKSRKLIKYLETAPAPK